MGLWRRVQDYFSGKYTYEYRKASADRLFDELDRKLKQHERSELTMTSGTLTQEQKTLTPEQKKKYEKALAVDFSSYTGYLPDERLEDLAATWLHWNYEEKYQITFTEYVKAVVSKRWQEMVGANDYPVSTIRKQYKMNSRYLDIKYATRRSTSWHRFLPVTFAGGILMFLTYVHYFI